MNGISKYFLYRKLLNRKPNVSVRNNFFSSSNDTRLNWTSNDGWYKVNCHKWHSCLGNYCYDAEVFCGDKKIACFSDGYLAKKIFKLADAVRAPELELDVPNIYGIVCGETTPYLSENFDVKIERKSPNLITVTVVQKDKTR